MKAVSLVVMKLSSFCMMLSLVPHQPMRRGADLSHHTFYRSSVDVIP